MLNTGHLLSRILVFDGLVVFKKKNCSRSRGKWLGGRRRGNCWVHSACNSPWRERAVGTILNQCCYEKSHGSLSSQRTEGLGSNISIISLIKKLREGKCPALNHRAGSAVDRALCADQLPSPSSFWFWLCLVIL